MGEPMVLVAEHPPSSSLPPPPSLPSSSTSSLQDRGPASFCRITTHRQPPTVTF